MLQHPAWSQAASRPHTLRFGRSFQSKRKPVPHPGRLPVSSHCQGGISSCRGCAAGGIVRRGAPWPRLQLPPLAVGPAPALAPFSNLLQLATPARAPSAARATSYLCKQHLVARFSGALLPRGLFPYLGGKRNRETERGPRLASGRLPARAAFSGRGMELGWAPQELRRPGWG